jgi:nicotinate phosphoribosyltransferase
VTPSRVDALHSCYWAEGKLTTRSCSLSETRSYVAKQLALMRPDHIRRVNPTPYKLALTPHLFSFMHELWLKHTIVGEIV